MTEHPELDPSDPRWVAAEFGAKVQELIDALTPTGYGRFSVDGWLLVAETVAPDDTRQIMTVPFDRYQIPKLVGMINLAGQIMTPPGLGPYGGAR